MEKHPLDKGSFLLLAVFIILFIAASLSDVFFLHWELVDTSFIPFTLLFILGFILFSLGLALRKYCERILSKQFSVFVAIQKEHQLIIIGPYKYIRHPIYSAGLLKAFGILLMTNSFLGFGVGVVLLFPALLYRIHIEEKTLLAHFGKKYELYKNTTKALIPHVL
ncbi:isoprenylcysteine carboxylmethyltransferase family protein [Candidatus Woesearchaeota archaeon]|nr:isoprenylcysteine carboxylmethyltransferase family protein [Candidatus Woesearchaeota archaeon]